MKALGAGTTAEPVENRDSGTTRPNEEDNMLYITGIVMGFMLGTAVGVLAQSPYWLAPPTLSQQQQGQTQQQTNQLYEQFLRQQLQNGLHRDPC